MQRKSREDIMTERQTMVDNSCHVKCLSIFIDKKKFYANNQDITKIKVWEYDPFTDIVDGSTNQHYYFDRPIQKNWVLIVGHVKGDPKIGYFDENGKFIAIECTYPLRDYTELNDVPLAIEISNKYKRWTDDFTSWTKSAEEWNEYTKSLFVTAN